MTKALALSGFAILKVLVVVIMVNSMLLFNSRPDKHHNKVTGCPEVECYSLGRPGSTSQGLSALSVGNQWATSGLLQAGYPSNHFPPMFIRPAVVIELPTFTSSCKLLASTPLNSQLHSHLPNSPLACLLSVSVGSSGTAVDL